MTAMPVLWMHVAPYAGAWIEIMSAYPINRLYASHPTRVRGLKSHLGLCLFCLDVAPYAGAWIEIPERIKGYINYLRRTLRGCVD